MSDQPTPVTPHEVALLRLVAQRLAGPPFEKPTDVVRWLGAMQAQDYPGAVTSVALRTRERSRAGVEAVVAHLRGWPGCADLSLKWSEAAAMPFHRLKVKVKREIVTMGVPVDPLTDAGACVGREVSLRVAGRFEASCLYHL